MAKRISPHDDFHTGLMWKMFLVLGIILAAVATEEYFLGWLSLNASINGAIGAFALICLAVAAFMFFFKKQFDKLSEIASDVESGKMG